MIPEDLPNAAAPRETAASHMVKLIPRATADMPMNTVIQSLRGQTFECADTIFVTDDEGRLEGIVRIKGTDFNLLQILFPSKKASARI